MHNRFRPRIYIKRLIYVKMINVCETINLCEAIDLCILDLHKTFDSHLYVALHCVK